MKKKLFVLKSLITASALICCVSACASPKDKASSDKVSSEKISSETETEQKKENETQKEETEIILENDTEAADSAENETEIMEADLENGYVVGIDPGHQGSWVNMSEQEPNGPGSAEYKPKASTGTQGSFTGIPEYQLNLDISLLLRDELEKRGYEVVLTREDNDKAISNSERALMAADAGADVYVRIHANGSDQSSVSGALGMAPSAQNPYVGNLAEDSIRLSECILNHYCEKTGFDNLGVQFYDNMTGINWSKVPVTILEMGFMTNEHDDRAMQDKDMQYKMADGIADGIDEYFGLDPERVSASESSDISDKDPEKTDQEDDREETDASKSPVDDILSKYLEDKILEGQIWSFSIEDYQKNKTYSYMQHVKMQSASVIKVFIMGAVYDRMCYPSSADRLISANESYEGELRSLLEAMISVSDNDAANQLITKLGEGDFKKGAAVVNEFCKENGYDGTSVGRKFLEENPTGDNYTTAGDCRNILADIYNGECVSKEASEKMLDILKMQTRKNKICTGLPENYMSANKTGEMPEGYGLGCIENDMAIVFSPDGDYSLTVLSNNLEGANEDAIMTIRDISSFTAEWIKNNKG